MSCAPATCTRVRSARSRGSRSGPWPWPTARSFCIGSPKPAASIPRARPHVTPARSWARAARPSRGALAPDLRVRADPAPRRGGRQTGPRYARALPAPPLRARDAPTHARRDYCVRQGGPRRRRHLARRARLGSGRSPDAHGLQRLGLARTVDLFTVPDTVHVTCPRAPPIVAFVERVRARFFPERSRPAGQRALTTRTPLSPSCSDSA